jgi:ribosome-binding factor A
MQILQQAVCPERRRGFDGALSALASVTEVQISNDLQVAKVYLSIYR